MFTRHLTNKSERIALTQLSKGLAASRFHVSKKVGIKDVIDASRSEVQEMSKTRQRLYWTGHFDFVCTCPSDDDAVVFVAEYDGKGHFAPGSDVRDRAKNALCRDARLPILRIEQDNLVREFEGTSVVEWMATLFSGWNESKDEWEAWWQKIADESPDDVGDPGPLFHFQIANPFPPRIASFNRVHDALRKYNEANNAGRTIDFSVNPGAFDGRRDRVESHGTIFEEKTGSCGSMKRIERDSTLYFSRKRVALTWRLPVDDEAWENVGGVSLPIHSQCWSELPGPTMHSVMEEVVEYLVLRDMEDWARANLS